LGFIWAITLFSDLQETSACLSSTATKRFRQLSSTQAVVNLHLSRMSFQLRTRLHGSPKSICIGGCSSTILSRPAKQCLYCLNDA